MIHLSSLADKDGALLPPKFESSLKHPTKTRPRSPGRRKPSSSARRNLKELIAENSELCDNAIGVLEVYGSSTSSPGSKQVEAKLNFVDSRPRETADSKDVVTKSRQTNVNTIDLKTSKSSSSSAKVTMSAVQTSGSASLFTSRSDKNVRRQNGSPSSLPSKQDGRQNGSQCEYSKQNFIRTKSEFHDDNYLFDTRSDSSDIDDVPPPPPPISLPLIDDNEGLNNDIHIQPLMASDTDRIITPTNTRLKELNEEYELHTLGTSSTNNIEKHLSTVSSGLIAKQTDDFNRTSRLPVQLHSDPKSTSANSKLSKFSNPTSPPTILPKSSIWQTKDPTGQSKSDRRRRFKPVSIPDESELAEEPNENLSKTLQETNSKAMYSNSSDKFGGTFPGLTKGVSLYDSWILSRNSKESGRHSANNTSAKSANTEEKIISSKTNFEKARDVFSKNKETTKLPDNENFNETLKTSDFQSSNSDTTADVMMNVEDDGNDIDTEMEQLDQPADGNSLLTRNLSCGEVYTTASEKPAVVIEYDSDHADHNTTDDSTSDTAESGAEQDVMHVKDVECADKSSEGSESSPIHQLSSIEPRIIIEYDDGSDADYDQNETLKAEEVYKAVDSSRNENKDLFVDEMGKYCCVIIWYDINDLLHIVICICIWS